MNDPQNRVNWPLAVALGLLCLLPVYVASIGPVYWAIEHGSLSAESPVMVTYIPLVLTCHLCGLEGWLQWYLEFWIDL